MDDDELTRSFLGAAYLVSDRIISVLAKSELQGWSSIIGVITAICGNILISIALNVQRYAHIKISKAQSDESDDGESGKAKVINGQEANRASNGASKGRSRSTSTVSFTSSLAHQHMDGDHSDSEVHDEKNPDGSAKQSYLRSPYWWIGISLMTVGEMGNFLAYGFAPASIVAPLGVVALVSNCVIAPIVLKERFRARDFLGVVVAAAGAVVVVLSAKQQNAKLGPGELQALILRWEFALYSAITISFIVAGMWASNKYGHRTMVIDLGLVGLFGGYTALSTKGVASLISSTTWHVFTFPITYILVLVLVATALLQIRYINRALQRFSSVQIIPGQYVCFTISVVVGSAVLYRDFETTTAGQVGKFILGCILTFGGVYMLSSGKGEDSGSESKGTEEEESSNHVGDGDSLSHEQAKRGEARRRLTSGTTNEEGSESENPAKSPINKRSVSFRSTASSAKRSSRRGSEQINALTPSVTVYTGPTPDERTPLVDRHASSSRTSGSITPTQNDNVQLRPPMTPRAATYSRRQSTSDRPSLRQSISHLAGPLTSPLSASLAAVVADANRRGFDAVVSPAKRGQDPSRSSHARAGLRKSQSQGMSERTVVADESGAVVLPYDPRESEESVLSPKKSINKIRNVGQSISELFTSGSYTKSPADASHPPAPQDRGREQSQARE